MNKLFWSVLVGTLLHNALQGMQIATYIADLQREVKSESRKQANKNFTHIDQLIPTICSMYVDFMVNAIKGKITLAYAKKIIGATRYAKHNAADLAFLKEVKAGDLGPDESGHYLFAIPTIDKEFQAKLCRYIMGRLEALLTTVAQPIIADNEVCSHLNPHDYEEYIQMLIKDTLPLCVSLLVELR